MKYIHIHLSLRREYVTINGGTTRYLSHAWGRRRRTICRVAVPVPDLATNSALTAGRGRTHSAGRTACPAERKATEAVSMQKLTGIWWHAWATTVR
jgi:hypothetical protein